MALQAIVHCDGYSYEEIIETMNDETIQKSRAQFEKFRRDGIILSEKYEDKNWIMTDEVSKGAVISFQLDEVHYMRETAPKLACSLSEYEHAMRIVVTTRFGYSIKTLQANAAVLREFANGLIIPTDYSKALVLADLLVLLPGNTSFREEVQSAIDDLPPVLRSNGKQRVLAHYQTYLRFLDLLNRFWEEASSSERILYFPVWFWFCITGVLPLRPTECVLTPRQCISHINGKYYLEVRRTRKKGLQQGVRYHVEHDFELCKYPIANHLAIQILEYIAATQDVYESDIDVLFCKKSQFAGANVVGENDKHYTYGNLRQCLAYFYQNIIQGKYGYIIAADEQGLGDGMIGKINLGDMRHIAMISLVISGGSPSICKELAGHDSIVISANYYDNLKSFLDVLGYERYRESKPNSCKAYGLAISRQFPVQNGYCQSENVLKGDYSPCESAVNSDGMPGSCQVCRWFLPEKRLGDARERMSSELKQTCTLLRQAIEQIREGLGSDDTISSILDRLAAQSRQYTHLSAMDWAFEESEG